MQPVRPNREPSHEISTRGGTGSGSVLAVRNDLPSLFNNYGSSQVNENERLEAMERERALFKGSVKPTLVSLANEHELTRTNSIKKSSVPHSTSNRSMSAPRTSSAAHARKPSTDEASMGHTNDGPFSRPLPLAPVGRSKSFHDNAAHPPASPLSNTSDETNLLRSYKAHLEQVLRKDAPPFVDVRVPNYQSIEDVFRSNEQLLLENERLRADLNRLKTESILLVRSMRPPPALTDSNSGNERIAAERERQELAIELARQVEENKRLRRSLLSQSAKFVTLRQMSNSTDSSSQAIVEQQTIPKSAPQSTSSSSKPPQPSKLTRPVVVNRRASRTPSFNHGSQEPS